MSQNETQQAGAAGIRKALVTTGEIAAPAGIVGLVCQLFGVTAKMSATLSIATIVVASIVLFHRKIERWVRPVTSMVVAVLAIVVSIIVVDVKWSNPAGITHVERRANDFLGGPLNKLLNSAKSTITLFGTSFHITAGDSADVFLRALSHGVHVKMLVVHPTMVDMEQLSKDFDVPKSELLGQARTSLLSLRDLSRRWMSKMDSARSPGELSIRLSTSIPRMRAYMIDNDIGYVVPYINSMNSARTHGLLLMGGSVVLEDYNAGIAKEWNDAVELDTFLAEYPKFLAN